MNTTTTASSLLRALIIAVVALALVGCPTDSPTAPKQQPPTPTGSTGAWNINITPNPASLSAGGTSTILTVVVRRAGSAEPPPDGASVAILTTLGDFGSAGSGSQSGFLTLVGGLAQVALFPGQSGGTAVVQVQLEQSIGQISISINQVLVGEFYIDRVDPSSGSVDGGDSIEVHGVGFAEPVRVFFGGLPADVQSVASSVIRLLNPEAESATGGFIDVTVTIRFGTSEQETFTFSSGFRYEGATQPAIFSVTPSFGSNDGGDTLLINGEGFNPASTQVFFGSGTVTSFDGIEGTVMSVSETQIEVVTPSATDFGRDLRNELVDVLVRNIGGNGDILSSAFRFGFQVKITAVEPLAGPYFGGDVVKIHGEGFDRQPLTLEYGLEVQEDIVHITRFIIRTISEPILTQSCSDQKGPSIVTILDSGDQAMGALFTYEVVDWAPRITDVNPSGLRQTGQRVSISGQNFDPSGSSFPRMSVKIAGRAVNINSYTNTRITVNSPSFGDSFFATDSCVTGGGDDGERLLSTPADIVVTNDDTTCEDSFTGSVLIEPADPSCRATAAP